MELVLDNYAKFIIGNDMINTFKHRMLEDDVINYSKINNNTILIVFKIKRLDIYNISCIKEIVDTAYNNIVKKNKKGFNVILDCNSITYIDSSAVGALLNSWQKLNKIKRQLILCNVNNILKQTFKNLSLNNFFYIYNSVEDSVKSLMVN
jgi:anti-anti-sigma factor